MHKVNIFQKNQDNFWHSINSSISKHPLSLNLVIFWQKSSNFVYPILILHNRSHAKCSLFVTCSHPILPFYGEQERYLFFPDLVYLLGKENRKTLRYYTWSDFGGWLSQIREQMSGPEISWYGESILSCGCGLGWTVGKKGLGWLWATFEARFFPFLGSKNF